MAVVSEVRVVTPTSFGSEGGGVVRCANMTLKVMKEQEEKAEEEEEEGEEKKRSGGAQFDIWNSIQESSSKKDLQAADVLPPPYVHPLLRRSSSRLSQKSLETCTESLGSETGSDGFSDVDDYFSSSSPPHPSPSAALDGEGETEEQSREDEEEEVGYSRLSAVNYHCSMGRRSPPRSFPPPLPSITRRDGPCFRMQPHRRDGRLVLEAVPAPSHSYLHCQRQGGRLRLSFIETAFEEIYPADIRSPVVAQVPQQEGEEVQEQEQEEEVVVEEEEDVEEEVEVVDRGIVVEVKVSSRQPQTQSGGMKVHRSSLVINKFVGGTPLLPSSQSEEKAQVQVQVQVPAALAVVADAEKRIPVLAKEDKDHESTWSVLPYIYNPNMAAAEVDDWGCGSRRSTEVGGYFQNKGVIQEKKLLFTTKKVMNREALLHRVRRCSNHHRPLFIWEPCCVATS